MGWWPMIILHQGWLASKQRPAEQTSGELSGLPEHSWPPEETTSGGPSSSGVKAKDKRTLNHERINHKPPFKRFPSWKKASCSREEHQPGNVKHYCLGLNWSRGVCSVNTHMWMCALPVNGDISANQLWKRCNIRSSIIKGCEYMCILFVISVWFHSYLVPMT